MRCSTSRGVPFYGAGSSRPAVLQLVLPLDDLEQVRGIFRRQRQQRRRKDAITRGARISLGEKTAAGLPLAKGPCVQRPHVSCVDVSCSGIITANLHRLRRGRLFCCIWSHKLPCAHARWYAHKPVTVGYDTPNARGYAPMTSACSPLAPWPRPQQLQITRRSVPAYQQLAFASHIQCWHTAAPHSVPTPR